MQNEKALSPKATKSLLAVVSLLLVCAIIVQILFWTGVLKRRTQPSSPQQSASGEAVGSLSREGYTLEQVVVLSRHNIRAPLSGSGSALDKLTPHKWFDWSSNPSELSLRGGVLETEMGQYFRKWLESEGLFPENYHPEGESVRIYANSKQRTIATARYFTSGLLPTSPTSIETHVEFDKMDPVFTPQLTFVSPEYNAAAEEQMRELIKANDAKLEKAYRLLTEVIDMKDSEAWKDGSATEFKTGDTELILNELAEPGMKGSLKTACSVTDALVLQYYEQADPVKAAFGHELTAEQWRQLSEIKDIYGDVLFTAPLVSVNVAHPLLEEIEKEFKAGGREFTFLCGHDSNVGSVLAALGAQEYKLPGSIEKTPIGCKLVFSRWSDASGKKFISLDMVYQTVEQLRSTQLLDIAVHPAIVGMRFSGLNANGAGLYEENDFMNLLRRSIEAYDLLIDEYALQPAA